MNKLIITLLLIVFFSVSCKKNKCEDKKVALYYNYAVKNLSKQYIEEMKHDTILKMEVFLTMITNHRPSKNLSWGDELEYALMKDLKEDIKYWKTWYHNNKCWLTTQRIDSIYNDIQKNKNYLDINLELSQKKYPKKWEDLFSPR